MDIYQIVKYRMRRKEKISKCYNKSKNKIIILKRSFKENLRKVIQPYKHTKLYSFKLYPSNVKFQMMKNPKLRKQESQRRNYLKANSRFQI